MTSRCLNVFFRRHLSSSAAAGGGGGGGAGLATPFPSAPPPSPICPRQATATMSTSTLTAQDGLSSLTAPPPTPTFRHQQLRCATTRESGAVLDEPRREVRYGLLKVFFSVFTGLSIGAWVSQKMAAFLEENELFVPEDDDDDDDD